MEVVCKSFQQKVILVHTVGKVCKTEEHCLLVTEVPKRTETSGDLLFIGNESGDNCLQRILILN